MAVSFDNPGQKVKEYSGLLIGEVELHAGQNLVERLMLNNLTMHSHFT